MNDLIARLKAAAGPDRELNLQIWRAVTGRPWRWEPRVDGAITWDRYGPGAAGNPVVSLDDFTGSIDAAATLLKPNEMWAVGMDEDGQGCADAPRHGLLVTAATPAIALCIVALEAKDAGRTPAATGGNHA